VIDALLLFLRKNELGQRKKSWDESVGKKDIATFEKGALDTTQTSKGILFFEGSRRFSHSCVFYLEAQIKRESTETERSKSFFKKIYTAIRRNCFGEEKATKEKTDTRKSSRRRENRAAYVQQASDLAPWQAARLFPPRVLHFLPF
jgi:hypothetical protein